MIRHIIMFKFTDVMDDIDKAEKANKMKSVFGDLKSQIEVIQSYEIGINMKKTDFSYDMSIISEFKSWEDLDIYLNHPDHFNAIKACSNIKKEKAIVDYEY